MKKLMPILVIGILVLGGLRAGAGTESEYKKSISETIIFSQPIIYEEENYISIELPEETTKSLEKDKPLLPIVSKIFTFPFNTRIDSVSVIFSNPEEMSISKPVIPSPEIYIDSNEYMQKKIVDSNDVITYSDINVYPEKKYSYKTGAGLDDEEHVIYLSITLYPIQYKPKESKIYYSERASIEIKYTLPENPAIFPDEYDFLIIAPAEFESALQTLVDHKNNLNPPIRTIMVSLDDIPSGVGVDEQEDIKYFIKDKIENWGITYLLLVGAGVTGQELFPVRYAWIGDSVEQKFPSDLYYADIYNDTGDFSNWDKDGDGKYAEYPVDFQNVDVIPDIHLGKLPCNNVAEVNLIVDKIINYKAHNKMTKRILQVGGDSFADDDVYEGEYANTVVLTKLPGYSTTQLWGSNGKLTKMNVAKGFKYSVDFVDFCGHGSWGSFATHPPKDDSVWIPPSTPFSPYAGFRYSDFDLFNVNNDYKLPVCVYKSCSNSKYNASPNCFSWATLNRKGGGIATFAASGISYGAHGEAIVDHYTGWMEVHTFEELITTKILGQVWSNDVEDYYNNFDPFSKEDWKTMIEWSMFGDPTLVIEDGDDPKNIPVNIPIFYEILERLTDYFPVIKLLLERLFFQ